MSESSTRLLFPAVHAALARGRRDGEILDGRSFDEAFWDAAEAALDRAESALRNWSECYPEDVFIPITDEQQKAVVSLLREHGYTPDALYAHWGRHIVGSLREALGA